MTSSVAANLRTALVPSTAENALIPRTVMLPVTGRF